jgi:hypothetical protein
VGRIGFAYEASPDGGPKENRDLDEYSAAGKKSIAWHGAGMA